MNYNVHELSGSERQKKDRIAVEAAPTGTTPTHAVFSGGLEIGRIDSGYVSVPPGEPDKRGYYAHVFRGHNAELVGNWYETPHAAAQAIYDKWSVR